LSYVLVFWLVKIGGQIFENNIIFRGALGGGGGGQTVLLIPHIDSVYLIIELKYHCPSTPAPLHKIQPKLLSLASSKSLYYLFKHTRCGRFGGRNLDIALRSAKFRTPRSFPRLEHCVHAPATIQNSATSMSLGAISSAGLTPLEDAM
jgi:hypothetical protein